MITYRKVKDGVAVFLDGRRTGIIVAVFGGFCYKTRGAVGETMPSVAAVKRSLEAE